MDIEVRKKWSMLRHQYYSSGRNEMLLGNYDAAGILLGYAVKTSFKHALIESEFNDSNILMKHEPQILMRACKEFGVLDEIEISNDFLDYINDHFKPRYPILSKEVQDDIEAKGRTNIIGPLLLSWYDDIIFQIDNWLIKKTSDNLASCFFRATADIKSFRGKLFFHANYHACMMIENLIEMWKRHDGDNSLIIKELEKGKEYHWEVHGAGILPPQIFNNVNYSKNFAKRFHYSTWSGDTKEPYIHIKNWNCIMINLLPWE